jgi:hypothetical protein
MNPNRAKLNKNAFLKTKLILPNKWQIRDRNLKTVSNKRRDGKQDNKNIDSSDK